MSLAGLGAVAIWHDLLPAAKDDFYEWHNREHMPERVGIPGFRRGRRFVAISGAPEFFNLYEADSPETLSGQDYLNRLNAPTAWTQRVIPSFRNVARSICRVAFTNGVGSGGVMLTLRFAIDAAHRDSTIDALRRRAPASARVSQGHRRRPSVPGRRRREQHRNGGEESARRHDARAVVDRAHRRHFRARCRRRRRRSRAHARWRTLRRLPSARSTVSSSRASRRRGARASAFRNFRRSPPWPSCR